MYDDSVAQLVEHLTFNQVVPGSNPGGITPSNFILLKTRFQSNFPRTMKFSKLNVNGFLNGFLIIK